MSAQRQISFHDLSDADIIAMYKRDGSMDALGELYNRYKDLVYGVCLKYLKEPERSKDAVADIFESMVGKLKQHEISNFKSWLHTLSKNFCLMQLRTPRNLKTVEIHEETVQSEQFPHLADIREREEHFNLLSNCLENLSAEQKEAVDLFYLQNKCYKEIAVITGLEWNSIRSNIQNGRRNLKICMEKNLHQRLRQDEMK